MPTDNDMSTVARWLKVSRAPFLAASAVPVILGTCLAFSVTGHFRSDLFALALFGIMFIHAGANLANEYFDHLLGADRLNPRPSPLFGGSGSIQNGLVSPRAILIAAGLCLAIGAALGLAIVAITRSVLVLAVGIFGIAGAWCYTAPPLKLAYRTFGEVTIALLFGILPVWASYYIQTGTFDLVPLIPSLIASILIFEVILANEFPDAPTDAAVGKRTIVVRFGPHPAALIYVLALAVMYAILAGAFHYQPRFSFAWRTFLWTLPAAITASAFLYCDILTGKKVFRFNVVTIILQIGGCLLLAARLLSAR